MDEIQLPTTLGEETLEKDLCFSCAARLARMRKSAVRWLYLEWYKKAILGQELVSIHELAPSLLKLLWSNHCEAEDYDGHPCKACATPIEAIISEALAPLPQALNMYANATKERFATSEDGINIQKDHTKDGISSISAVTEQSIAQSLKNEVDASNNPDEIESQQKQQVSAASFFTRAAMRLSLSKKKGSKKSPKHKSRYSRKDSSDTCSNCTASEPDPFSTNFNDLIMRSPPQAPPSLFKFNTRKLDSGKAKVILKLSGSQESTESYMKIEQKRKQLAIHEPEDNTKRMRQRIERAPKLYSFDAAFDKDTSAGELCSSSLVDLLHAVSNGNDATLMTYGYPLLGKTHTMIGTDDHSANVGVIPCAISWLYQLIDDRKERTGARFSVRVSAVEVVGRSENVKDLLGDHALVHGSTTSISTSPSLYFPREKSSTVQLSDFTEMRAPTAERACYLLDAAITAREFASKRNQLEPGEDPDESKNSHMIFTLHVYQYLIDKVGAGEIHGGRSRLHMIDLSGCSGVKRTVKDSTADSWLPLSSLGNVIVALTNGAKHTPHKDSKLVSLLRECIGSLSSRVTFLTHISSDPKHFSEAISTLQLTTRIHRSRKRKNVYSSTSSSGGESSCDESRRYRRSRVTKPVTPMFVTEAREPDLLRESEFASTSAAEDSCDTVIYLGPKGSMTDQELSDFEHPPSDVKSRLDQITKDLEEDSDDSDHQPVSHPIPLPSPLPSKRNRSHSIQSEQGVFTTKRKELLSDSNNLSQRSLYDSPTNRKSQRKVLAQTNSNLYRSLEIGKRTYDDNGKIYPGIVNPANVILPYATPYSSRRKMNNNTSITNFYDPATTQSSTSLPVTLSQSCTGERSFGILNKQLSDGTQSNYSMSSQASVESFERRLVSHVSERFAVEAEFLYVANKMDTSLQSIEIPSKLDEIVTSSKNEATSEELINHRCNNDNVDDGISIDGENYDLFDENDITRKEINEFTIRRRPSMESLREMIESRGYCLTHNRDMFGSISSCGSLSGSPKLQRKLITGPSSEGISSGYESMRCESNANLHLPNEKSSHRRKGQNGKDTSPTITKKNDKGKDECTIEEGRFTKSKDHKKKVETLIGKREGLRSQLRQTLDKLVVGSKSKLPDIDVRLHSVSLEEPQAVRVLNRENKILARKIDVCKSHLQIVTCFDVRATKKQRRMFKVTSV